MRVRRRLGGAICLIPFFVVLIIGRTLDNKIIELIAINIAVLLIIFSTKIYNLIFYNSNSLCAKYAGNMALRKGFSPKAQNGIIWSPDNYKINEIYNLYLKNRTNIPIKDSSGFLFYTNRRHTHSRYMEFYEYNSNNNYIVHFEFYFHPYKSEGDSLTEKKLLIAEVSKNMIFVPLERISE